MTLLKAHMRRYHCGRRTSRYWLHQFRRKVKEYKSFLKAENGNKAKQIAIENFRRAYTNTWLKQKEGDIENGKIQN